MVTTDPSLGAIVMGTGAGTLPTLAHLTAAVHRWPWVIPCILLPKHEDPVEPLLMLVSELRGRLAVARLHSSAVTRDPAFVLAAVREREEPGPSDLASWIARRLGEFTVEEPLGDQFRQVMEGVPASRSLSRATYSRFFSRQGKYSAHDWRAIARLCARSAGSAAFGTSCLRPLSLRAASTYARRYLGVSYSALSQCLGWEWILEASLRVGGYLEMDRDTSSMEP